MQSLAKTLLTILNIADGSLEVEDVEFILIALKVDRSVCLLDHNLRTLSDRLHQKYKNTFFACSNKPTTLVNFPCFATDTLFTAKPPFAQTTSYRICYRQE